MLSLLFCVTVAIEISPPIAGQDTFLDAPYPPDVDDFFVSGRLAVAASCACEWSEQPEGRRNLEGLVLLVPSASCSEASACNVADAICSAASANASGVLLACDYRYPREEGMLPAVRRSTRCRSLRAASTSRLSLSAPTPLR